MQLISQSTFTIFSTDPFTQAFGSSVRTIVFVEGVLLTVPPKSLITPTQEVLNLGEPEKKIFLFLKRRPVGLQSD